MSVFVLAFRSAFKICAAHISWEEEYILHNRALYIFCAMVIPNYEKHLIVQGLLNNDKVGCNRCYLLQEKHKERDRQRDSKIFFPWGVVDSNTDLTLNKELMGLLKIIRNGSFQVWNSGYETQKFSWVWTQIAKLQSMGLSSSQ